MCTATCINIEEGIGFILTSYLLLTDKILFQVNKQFLVKCTSSCTQLYLIVLFAANPCAVLSNIHVLLLARYLLYNIFKIYDKQEHSEIVVLCQGI